MPRMLAPVDATALLLADDNNAVESIQAFQQSHAFLIGILVTVVSRAVIREVRIRFEKPVFDELGNRVKEELTIDKTAIDASAWAKLVGCIALDLAGDASELLPVLGEFTDLAYAPVEASLLKVLFKSNAIAGARSRVSSLDLHILRDPLTHSYHSAQIMFPAPYPTLFIPGARNS